MHLNSPPKQLSSISPPKQLSPISMQKQQLQQQSQNSVQPQNNNNLKDISSKNIAFVRKIGQGQFGDVYEGTLRDLRGMIVSGFFEKLEKMTDKLSIEDPGSFKAP